MADLKNLTNDEQVILFNAAAFDVLINMVSKLTGKDKILVQNDVAMATKSKTSLMTDIEAKNFVEKHRRIHREIRKAAKQ